MAGVFNLLEQIIINIQFLGIGKKTLFYKIHLRLRIKLDSLKQSIFMIQVKFQEVILV